MRRRLIGSFVFVLCVSVPALTTAQERVPHEGSTAVGVDVGAFVPNSDGLDSALLVNLLYEYYLTPRVSLRPVFGWANTGLQNEVFDSLRQVPLRLDVNYNWERGRWHPFVGTGVGAYFIQVRRDGESFSDTETKLGVNVGGGVEYFINRRVTLKGEGRYHAIQNAFGREPSGLALTAGLKTYF
jgi:hypothetical protein